MTDSPLARSSRQQADTVLLLKFATQRNEPLGVDRDSFT